MRERENNKNNYLNQFGYVYNTLYLYYLFVVVVFLFENFHSLFESLLSRFLNSLLLDLKKTKQKREENETNDSHTIKTLYTHTHTHTQDLFAIF